MHIGGTVINILIYIVKYSITSKDLLVLVKSFLLTFIFGFYLSNIFYVYIKPVFYYSDIAV
jgi:hypothetical protein